MTRAKDISKILTDANISGTLDVSGAFTSQGIDDNADATAITIDSAERVGIGIVPDTTSNGKSLQINRTLINDDDAGSLHISQNGYYNSAWKYVENGTAEKITFGTGIITFDRATSNSGGADASLSWSESMRINSSGAVSIGTTASPNNAPLLIHCGTDDNIRFNQETHATISAVNDVANAFVALKLEGDDILLNSQSGNNVAIGTSSADSNHKLEVTSGGTSEVGIRSGNTNEAILNFGRTNDRLRGRIAYNNSSEYLAFWTNQGEKMRIDSSGNVGINTANPSTLLHLAGTFGFGKAAMSSATTAGDFTITLSNLTTLNGANWREHGLLMYYMGVDGSLANSTTLFTSIRLRGLNTWDATVQSNIISTATISASSKTTTGVTITVDVPNNNNGTVFVLCLGGNNTPNISISG